MSSDTPDPAACPDCGTRFPPGAPRCPSCGLTLVGPAAAQLWTVAQQIAALERTRGQLLAALRPRATGDASTDYAVTVPSAGAAQPAPTWGPPSPPSGPPPAPTWGPPAPARPRAEWTPQRVQNLLLSLGVLLLVVAALIFAAVAWGRLGFAGRAAVLLAVTAAAAGAAFVALRRGLTATAQATATFAVVLALVDAYALRRGVSGLGATDEATYWSIASGVVGTLSAAFAAVVRIHAPRVAAAVLLQLPALITASRLAGDEPGGVLATLLAGQLVALIAVGRATAARYPDVRWLVDTSAAGTWIFGVALAVVDAFPDVNAGRLTDDAALAVGGLVALSIAATAVAWMLRADVVARAVAAAAVVITSVLALIAPARLEFSKPQLPAVVAAIGLFAVVCSGLLARAWRHGPLTASATTVAVAVAMVAGDVVTGVAGPLSWLTDPWSANTALGARGALAPDLVWQGTVVTTVVLAVATATSVLVGELLHARRLALVPSGALAAAAVLLVPLGQAWSYDLALAWDVGVGVLLLAAASYYAGRHATISFAAAGTASVVLAVAVGWSLADRDATLFVLAVAALGYGVTALAAPALRAGAAAAAAMLECAWIFALARSNGAPVDRSGFVLAIAAGGVLALAATLRRRTADGFALEWTAAGIYAAALACTVTDAGWLSWALALGGLATLANSLRTERRDTAYVGGLLLSASSWVRLGLEDVAAPEPYAAPIAVVALVLGHLRRRRDDRVSSWRAYAGGLALALGPSLAVVLDGDPGLARPLLLGLAALLVLLYGVRERLQAPLVIGASVLAADAVVQVAPLAAALPRWVGIGTVGVLLLALGATYERRRRDLERLRERYAALG